MQCRLVRLGGDPFDGGTGEDVAEVRIAVAAVGPACLGERAVCDPGALLGRWAPVVLVGVERPAWEVGGETGPVQQDVVRGDGAPAGVDPGEICAQLDQRRAPSGSAQFNQAAVEGCGDGLTAGAEVPGILGGDGFAGAAVAHSGHRDLDGLVSIEPAYPERRNAEAIVGGFGSFLQSGHDGSTWPLVATSPAAARTARSGITFWQSTA